MTKKWRSVLLAVLSLMLAAQIIFAVLMIVGAIAARGTAVALPGLGIIVAGPLLFLVPLIIDLLLVVPVSIIIILLRRSARLP